MKTKALIIFTRNPELGKVKTRLAKSIGDPQALQVYKDLLQHTMEQTQNLDSDNYVFYDTKVIENDIWNSDIYFKKVQAKGDLGNKMQMAFEMLFDLGYQKCIIIGSDLFDLKTAIINKAFDSLDIKEVVLGPAEDGGYYLLGLNQSNTAIFQNKPWGTSTVLEMTLNDLKQHSVHLLETLNDIDTIEDLERSNYILK
ncbi:TIGR04282 family arsenosugar biosynthesis glycosyltransferase [Flavobacterium sp.]|uniref:TIGR04282 family arsenosugar biosynthesis glycosyltransferase n=1 Tax=Flavobacterium sp. TaxID=239 RepID=UPI003C380303